MPTIQFSSLLTAEQKRRIEILEAKMDRIEELQRKLKSITKKLAFARRCTTPTPGDNSGQDAEIAFAEALFKLIDDQALGNAIRMTEVLDRTVNRPVL